MTPADVILRFLVNNPQPLGLPHLAAAIVMVLQHAGFEIKQKEPVHAE
ncbi:hypothetical protein ACWIGM_09110 [Bosea sp. NPDC055332]